MRLVRAISGALLVTAIFFFVACGTTPPLPDDGFVDVPGGRVSFRVIGKGDGIPVLMIHGGPGSTSCNYVSTLSGVAGLRPVVMYDQLGSGKLGSNDGCAA